MVYELCTKLCWYQYILLECSWEQEKLCPTGKKCCENEGVCKPMSGKQLAYHCILIIYYICYLWLISIMYKWNLFLHFRTMLYRIWGKAFRCQRICSDDNFSDMQRCWYKICGFLAYGPYASHKTEQLTESRDRASLVGTSRRWARFRGVICKKCPSAFDSWIPIWAFGCISASRNRWNQSRQN